MRSKGFGVLAVLVAAVAWGAVCGVFRTHFWAAATGGISLAAAAFWMERATLLSRETKERKDFHLIAIAGFGFFAVIGVGIVSLSDLIATWYLPRL